MKVTFPESLESISEECFNNTALKNITVSGNVEIAEDAFPDDCEVFYEWS